MKGPTPNQLRSRVVTIVLAAICGLAFMLYPFICAMLWTGRDVPDALWLAAGGAATAIYGLLNNSKGGSEGGSAVQSVSIEQPDGEPVPVVQAPRTTMHSRRDTPTNQAV